MKNGKGVDDDEEESNSVGSIFIYLWNFRQKQKDIQKQIL